jgi:hypothetical protein
MTSISAHGDALTLTARVNVHNVFPGIDNKCLHVMLETNYNKVTLEGMAGKNKIKHLSLIYLYNVQKYLCIYGVCLNMLKISLYHKE